MMTTKQIAFVLIASTVCMSSACDFLRPRGKEKLALGIEERTSHIEAGWFVFGGGPKPNINGTCPSEELSRQAWRLAYLPGYRIDRWETTNAEYLECVQSGKCTYPGDCVVTTSVLAELSGDLSPLACRFARSDVALEPVREVTWTQAIDYCEWKYGENASLPTEAQWEKAAVGAAPPFDFEKSELPRSKTPIGPLNGCAQVVQASGGACVADNAWPQENNDAYPDNEEHPFAVFPYDKDWHYTEEIELDRWAFGTPEEVYDLAGNVAEWVLDAKGDAECNGPLLRPPGYHILGNYLSDCEDTSRCSFVDYVDLPGPPNKWCNPAEHEYEDRNAEHVVKGGSYETGFIPNLSPRARPRETGSEPSIGFRCAIWDQDPDKFCSAPESIANATSELRDLLNTVDAGQADAASPADAAAEDAN